MTISHDSINLRAHPDIEIRGTRAVRIDGDLIDDVFDLDGWIDHVRWRPREETGVRFIEVNGPVQYLRICSSRIDTDLDDPYTCYATARTEESVTENGFYIGVEVDSDRTPGRYDGILHFLDDRFVREVLRYVA